MAKWMTRRYVSEGEGGGAFAAPHWRDPLEHTSWKKGDKYVRSARLKMDKPVRAAPTSDVPTPPALFLVVRACALALVLARSALRGSPLFFLLVAAGGRQDGGRAAAGQGGHRGRGLRAARRARQERPATREAGKGRAGALALRAAGPRLVVVSKYKARSSGGANMNDSECTLGASAGGRACTVFCGGVCGELWRWTEPRSCV